MRHGARHFLVTVLHESGSCYKHIPESRKKPNGHKMLHYVTETDLLLHWCGTQDGGCIRLRFSETGPRLITVRPIYHGHLIMPTNITVTSQWQFFTGTREGKEYVKTQLSCILFIMMTTTCFGHCGPSLGHKYIYIYIYIERERERERGKLYRVWS